MGGQHCAVLTIGTISSVVGWLERGVLVASGVCISTMSSIVVGFRQIQTMTIADGRNLGPDTVKSP